MPNVKSKLNKEYNFIYKEHMNKVLHRKNVVVREREQKERV